MEELPAHSAILLVHLPGARNDRFRENICSGKQILPRVFYNLRTSKQFLDDFSIHIQFSEAYLINSLRFSEV